MLADNLTLDDRREIWRLLEKLTPAGRVRFLTWGCRQLKGKGDVRVTSHTGKVGEAYHDLIALAVVYGLDLHAAACELERRVRRGG